MLSFLPGRMKIEKVSKFVANLHDKTEYVIHMRNLKQALNLRLVLRKVYRVIKFNQSAWLKPYIWYEHRSKKKTKNDFEKDFFKLMIDAVFGKLWKMLENRDIKLVTTERRRNYLLSESNYHTTKFFTENVLTIENEKNRDTYE